MVGREEEAAGCRRHRVATSFLFFGHLLALWTLRTKLPLRLPALRTMEMQPIAQICCDRSPRRSNFRRRVPHPSPSPFLSLFPFSVSLPFSSPCLVPEELQQATIGGDEAANRLSEFLLQQAPTDPNRIQVLEAGLARQKVSSWRFLDLSTPSEFHLLLAVEEAPADVVMQDPPARSQAPQEELSRGSELARLWVSARCRMRRAFASPRCCTSPKM